MTTQLLLAADQLTAAKNAATQIAENTVMPELLLVRLLPGELGRATDLAIATGGASVAGCAKSCAQAIATIYESLAAVTEKAQVG